MRRDPNTHCYKCIYAAQVLTYDLEWLRKELKSYGQARGFQASAAEAKAVTIKLPAGSPLVRLSELAERQKN